MEEIRVSPDISLYHAGPPLDLGPLPSLFYFALSGPDTLTLDPFNQPVHFLRGQMIRIFSLTLPAHEESLPAAHAMQAWADTFARGHDPLAPFLDQCQTALDFALTNGFADPTKLSTAGLSRGGLIAFHLAARDPRFRKILAYAPVTKLGALKEFAGKPNPYDALHLAPKLADRHIRFYIGNRDIRVSTQNCFDFAIALVQACKHSSPPIELILFPSIGRDGHGTSPETFQSGVQWIL